MSGQDSAPPSGRVLDENIGRLLRQAYVPVLPTPAFRNGLAVLWRSELRRRTTPARRLPRWAGLAAAAAVLLLAFGGWRARVHSSASPDGAALVAVGDVALRAGAGDWRAATETELADGLALADGALEIVTPARLPFEVHAAAGTLRAQAEAHLTLEPGVPGTAGLSGRLRRGALLATHDGSGPPWVLRTDPGALVLAEGAAEVEKRGTREHFLLRTGRARYIGPGGTLELVPGQELLVRAGIPETELVAAAVEPRGEERRAVEARTPAPDEPTEAVSMRGVVRAPDGAALTHFRLAVLHDRPANQIGEPLLRDFEDPEGSFAWPAGIEPGMHQVFVHAAGFAVASLGQVTFGPALDPAELDVTLSPGGTLRGHVVDSATGNPVPDALVLSEQDAPHDGLLFVDADRQQWLPASTRTRSDGSFLLEHLSPGTHTLRISAPGYGPAWSEAIRVEAEVLSAGTLVSLSAGGEVAGLVTHADGSAWAGATLVVAIMDQVSRPQTNFTQLVTDAEGRYRVQDMPAGMLLVVLVHLADMGRPTVKPVEIHPGRTARVDFLGDAPGVRFAGRIVDASGQPFRFQNMGLFSRRQELTGVDDFLATTTQADGRFQFDEVEPGAHLLYLVSEGAWIRLVDLVEIPAWGVLDHEVRVLDARIRGSVIDGRNGEALPGSVLLLGLEDPQGGETLFAGNTQADADGNYEFPLLNAGRYHVTAYPVQAGLGFERGPALELGELQPRAEVDLVLLGGGSVEVLVVDEEGTPIPYAAVEFADATGERHSFGRFATTDENGRYSALGLRPGAYQAVVGGDGFEQGQASFTCRVGEQGQVRVVLARTPAEDLAEDGRRTER